MCEADERVGLVLFVLEGGYLSVYGGCLSLMIRAVVRDQEIIMVE